MDRRFLICLLVLLLAVVGGILWWSGARPAGAEGKLKTMGRAAASKAPAASKPETPPVGEQRITSAVAATPDPARYRRAYLLALDGGRLKLENAQDVEGDFASGLDARKEEEWAGMLRCRLVSAEGKVLAEEVIPTPDQLCTVLDAHAGEPKPVSFATPGPVIFQLRLPRLAAAARLDIARITADGSLRKDMPVGSIALTSP